MANEILIAVIASIISYVLVEVAKRYFQFRVKAWIIPVVFLIGFFAKPMLVDLFTSDENESIAGKEFINQTLELDGKDYYDCTFISCRFLYKGKKKFSFNHCRFGGDMRFGLEGEASNTANMIKRVYNLSNDVEVKQMGLHLMAGFVYPDRVQIITVENDTLFIEMPKKPRKSSVVSR